MDELEIKVKHKTVVKKIRKTSFVVSKPSKILLTQNMKKTPNFEFDLRICTPMQSYIARPEVNKRKQYLKLTDTLKAFINGIKSLY